VSNQIAVMVVDDHPLVLEALAFRLSRHESLRVVATARSGADAVAQFQQRHDEIDVIVTDLSMPGTPSGPDVVRALLEVDPDAKVVAFTANIDTPTMVACLDLGATGFISKQVEEAELVACLANAAAGAPAFDSQTMARVVPALRAARKAVPLSDREHQVLAGLAEDLSTDEIARQLGIAPNTVRAHLNNLFAKLNVKDRAGAVAKAFREGVLH
jgi:DNA-binding NarL/FixJ family response regulator